MTWRKTKKQSWTASICLLFLLSHFSLSWADEKSGVKIESFVDRNRKAPQQKMEIDRSGWLQGKIEPVLAQEYKRQAELKVIVYIEAPDLTTVSRTIRGKFTPEIDSLSENIKSIHRKYRPKKSLKPDEEKVFTNKQRHAMTIEDRAELKALKIKYDANLDEMRQGVGVSLKQAVQPNQDNVIEFITSQGGVVSSRVSVISAIGATIPSRLLIPLAKHSLVLSIMKDRPTQLELDESMVSCDFDTWWDVGIDGGVFDFGIVDTGVQENHPAFSGITFFTNSGSNSDLHGHGTHVAGIAASGDGLYQGGAYGLDAIVWSIADANQTTVFNHMEWQADSAGATPEVINHSLGFGIANIVDYNDNDAFYDAFISHYNIMVTKSTGNFGWHDSDPTITHPATAYNLLSVANMDDQNTASRSGDVRWDTSSVGPTINDRKKPDITAPGRDIMSSDNDWENDVDFVSRTGTSMAAPHVAAAIILLVDGGNHNCLAQKAVLINTADAWNSQNTETTNDDGPIGGSHWDKSYGWGYLDMGEAFFHRTDYFEGSLVPNNNNATPDDYKLYKGVMSDFEKATLVWEKRSGYVAGSPPTSQYLLSDLDIILFDEADNSSVDSDVDHNDNVHQVSLRSGIEIDAVVKVESFSTSFDGASTESYVLATEENFIEANPPSFGILLALPSSVDAGTQFTVTAEITNGGEVAAHDNNVTLTMPSGFSIVSGSNPQDIRIINDGSSGQVSWTVLSSSTPGIYNLSASNSSNSYDEIYIGFSPSTPLAVGIPSQAISPSPSNGASYISINTTISWSDGGGATDYDVYFGTDATPDSGEFKGTQTGTLYDPGTLADGTTYYWRIDSMNSDGTTTGIVWSFTTNYVVNFPDTNLETEIRDAIEKPTGTIYGSDLLMLTSILSSNLAINDLTGLEYCTNLISLYLDNNQISDISALAGLTNLTVLYLQNNPLDCNSLLEHIPTLLAQGVQVYFDSGVDIDKDDDGIHDTDEMNTYGTDPCDADSDGDGIQDGTEVSFTSVDPTYTDINIFIADEDNTTQTDPLDDDSDNDTWLDGEEDVNFNGQVDAGESDPNDAGSTSGSIPTLNEWGMIIFVLLLITAGMVVIRRRQEQ